MLEDKLNAARQARRQHAVKIAVSVMGILILCALVLVFSTSCCDFVKKDEAEVVSALEKEAPVLSPAVADNPAARQQWIRLRADHGGEGQLPGRVTSTQTGNVIG